MIRTIEHHQSEQGDQIHQIFQRSYPYEGRLLGVEDKDFPPLKRTAEAIAESTTSFYGYLDGNSLAAVMELTLSEPLKINSFVVDPDYFKQGIGSKMMDFVFAAFPRRQYIVETGRENIPAIGLYRKFGFEIIEKYPLPQGIWKVVMEWNA
ncbi:MAG: ribosomal protein S18 acetylase RimI-like enzyme [Cyclobacteriaceae bacterium]|jgi:ribosomal protein S18 acetylase RimI-like enzyme